MSWFSLCRAIWSEIFGISKMAQILQKSVVRQSSELNADGETLQNFAKRSDTNGAILTDVTGKIIWVNQTFCHITGYESAELIGRNPRLLASGVHPKVFYEELWSTILSGKTWQGVVVNKNKDGSLGTHQTTISPAQMGINSTRAYRRYWR